MACEALTAGPRFAQAWASRTAQETSSCRWAVRPHPAERQQVVEQLLHAFGAVDGVLDVLVGLLVQPARVAALQQLAEACHLPQRLLQVMGGHVGELLEFCVRPLQVLGPGLQARVRRADGGQFRQDPLAHAVHVDPDGAHLLRAAGVDMVREVTVGHRAGVGGKPGQRPDHRYLEAEREDDQDDQQ